MADANVITAPRASISRNVVLGVLAVGLAISVSSCSGHSSAGQPLGPAVGSAKPGAPAPITSATQPSVFTEVSDAQARYYANYAHAFANPASVAVTQDLLALYVPTSPARKQIVQRLASFGLFEVSRG